MGRQSNTGKCIIICLTSGVPAKNYTSFAAAAEAKGFDVSILEYEPDKPLQYWITVQIPDAILAARRKFRDGELYLIGHSLGAQALGISGPWDQLDAIVRVAGSSGCVWQTRRPLKHDFQLLIALRAMALFFGESTQRAVGIWHCAEPGSGIYLCAMVGQAGLLPSGTVGASRADRFRPSGSRYFCCERSPCNR